MISSIRVNLLLWLHRGGQIHGIALLRGLLESQGCKVRTIITSRQSPAESFRADVNLFSSEAHPAWMPLAERNVLIANLEQDCRQSSMPLRPERFNGTRDQHRYLRRLDKLLVKTRVAREVFTGLGLPVAHVGFTSRDRYLPEITNVIYRKTYLSDDELRVLQNRCAVHVCPSAMEGFGHAIVEATSAGGLVITADATPMNEHVSEERGALYRVVDPQPHAFAQKWAIDEASLEQTVRRVMALSGEERRAKGMAAREHYLAAGERFRTDFIREWRAMVDAL